MKVLKNILVGILTFLLIVGLTCLGFSSNVKTTVKNSLITTVQNGISDVIVESIQEGSDIDKEISKEKIDNFIKENESAKKIADKYSESIFDVLNGKDVGDMNLSQDIENLIDDSDEILKEYDIELDSEDKETIKSFATSKEVADILNEGVTSVKEDMPPEVEVMLNIFNFMTSTTCIMILSGAVILIVLLIALLKKSLYKWLFNLGLASILSAVPLLLMNLVINLIVSAATENSITIDTSSLIIYGCVSIAFGIVEIVGNKLLSNKIDKVKLEEKEDKEKKLS